MGITSTLKYFQGAPFEDALSASGRRVQTCSVTSGSLYPA